MRRPWWLRRSQASFGVCLLLLAAGAATSSAQTGRAATHKLESRHYALACSWQSIGTAEAGPMCSVWQFNGSYIRCLTCFSLISMSEISLNLLKLHALDIQIVMHGFCCDLAMYGKPDNVLINCGGAPFQDVPPYSRAWLGDDSISATDNLTIKAEGQLSTTLPILNVAYAGAPLYQDARYSRFPASLAYTINVKSSGAHFVRLHFATLAPAQFQLNLLGLDPIFNVTASGAVQTVVLLANYNVTQEAANQFPGSGLYTAVVEEFLIPKVDDPGQPLIITFNPYPDTFAIISAIEVVSAQDDLYDVNPRAVTTSGVSENRTDAVHGKNLRMVYRFNCGGPIVYALTDPFSRTWLDTDGNYTMTSSQRHHLDATRPGGGPLVNNVNATALYYIPTLVTQDTRELRVSSVTNLTYAFPVQAGGMYIIRLIFSQYEDNEFDLSINDVVVDTVTNQYVYKVDAERQIIKTPIYGVQVRDFVVSLLPAQATLNISLIVGAKSKIFNMGTRDLSGIDRFYQSLGSSVSPPLSPPPPHSPPIQPPGAASPATSPVASPAQVPTTSGKKKSSSSIAPIVGGAVGGIAALLILASIIYIFLVKRKRVAINGNESPTPRPKQAGISKKEPLGRRFRLQELKNATNNFADNLLIGEGGFGKVYKGVLPDGPEVAIKRGVPNCVQGIKEFETEILLLSQLRHRHLVSLIGYCDERQEMLLVYDFMPNGTLRSHLYGKELDTTKVLTWRQRLEICVGACSGLNYLHNGATHSVIHRDVKSTNILLDEHFVAKVSDFGLSRLGPDLDKSHVSTTVKGSIGYLDPEYFRKLQLTTKSDVYSFGVVLLEVLCGRSPIDSEIASDELILVEWALHHLGEGTLYKVIDPNMQGQYEWASVEKVGELAGKCVRHDSSKRPAMGDVLTTLEIALSMLPPDESGVSALAPPPSIPNVNSLEDTMAAAAATAAAAAAGSAPAAVFPGGLAAAAAAAAAAGSARRRLVAATGIVALSSNDIRNGTSLELDGAPWRVQVGDGSQWLNGHRVLNAIFACPDIGPRSEFLHVKPGKGAAFVRTKLRNYVTGNTVERTFRAGESIDEATVTKEVMQYTYAEGDQYVFMDMGTYEETRLTAGNIGDKSKWLMEGMECNVLQWNGKVIDVELPMNVKLSVTQTDPGLKGDTASGGGTKPATLETGATIMVPLFINQGDTVPKAPPPGEEEEERRAAGLPVLPPGWRKPATTPKAKAAAAAQALSPQRAGPLARIAWFRVVLDEAQSIKNARTQVARAVWGLRAKRRWCLSGTPIQNAVDDLYSYFRFLRFSPYDTVPSFRTLVKEPITRNARHGFKRLQAILRSVLLRRTKATMIDGQPIVNLPARIVKLHVTDFSAAEAAFYAALESESRQQFQSYAAAGTLASNYVNILHMLLRLRQACDHPLLVRGAGAGMAAGRTAGATSAIAAGLPAALRRRLLALLTSFTSMCPDAPEEAAVSTCGHVYCRQCISDQLAVADAVPYLCATCRRPLAAAELFSEAALRLAEDGKTTTANGSHGAAAMEAKTEWPTSSKLEAVLAVLGSLPNVRMEVEGGRIKRVLGTGAAPGGDPCGSPARASVMKLEAADVDVVDSTEKAIVFSQWTSMLNLLEAPLQAAGLQFRRLDGTMNVNARERAIAEFSTRPEVTVMIMSLKAASLGLNMVAACHVLLLDVWWNPATEEQAIDRAHRIGQLRPVRVLRFTVRNTIEDRILELQEKKRRLTASAFGEEGGGAQRARLTMDDLHFLFRM
eukprot:SM000164S02273  [mRNA]  locus=s164:226762:245483:+ [translate_table: standard]